MSRRNPPSARRRRSGGPPEATQVAAEVAVRRRALVERRGCRRGTVRHHVRGLARAGEWWLDVDVRGASDAYVLAADALPPLPTDDDGAGEPQAVLDALYALCALARRERAGTP